MKRAILLLIPLLAGCGREDGDSTARGESREPVQTAELTGLYEASGEGTQRARMCIVPGQSGGSAFGIVTETAGGGSCAGAGQAVREGNMLRLTMGGDEACVIDARISGTQVSLPPGLPQGCSYYCGPGGTLAGTVLEKTGGTRQEAIRALDLAGGPLCG